MTARPCSAPRRPTAAAPGRFTTATLGRWRPQLHRHRDRCGRQHQRGLGGAQRDDRHRGAGGAGDRLVLDRQRHGRRRHHQRQHADADRHRRRPTARCRSIDGATLLGTATANGSGAWTFTTADAGRRQPTASPPPRPMRPAISARASAALSVTVDTAAPAAPAIASFSNDSGTAGDGITNDNTLTLTGTAAGQQHGEGL